MTFLLHIDDKPIAEFHVKEWAETFARLINKYEDSVSHLPHREVMPKRHIVLTCKHTGDIIFDSAAVVAVQEIKKELANK